MVWDGVKIEHGTTFDNKKCCIAIPIYKKEITKVEQASLKQVAKILGKKYEIVLVCPFNFDISYYNEIGEYNFSKLECDEYYSKSIKGYSDLCLEEKFYETFKEYEYMLIYQLDAWVFKDKLEYFIDKGYDYIGAPHCIHTFNGKPNAVGNGGFSLRKISRFIEVCHKYNFSTVPDWMGEDLVFTKYLEKEFNIAPMNVAFEFAFQDSPEYSYKMNKNKLPMGCHRFELCDYKWWKKWIKVE